MKKLTAMAAALVLLVFAIPAIASTTINLGVSAGIGGLNGFYMAVSNYNNVTPQEVFTVRQRGISDEELPVVFFIAGKAKVSREEIIKLRLKKWSWMRIVKRYKLDPAIFYVPVKERVKVGTYGKAYSYYQGRPQNKWKNIKLSDNDVTNFVNLRFVSEHYRYAPEEIIKMRDNGKNFIVIDNDLRGMNKNKVKVWKNGRDQDGYDKKGYDHNGYDRDGYNNKGRDWKGNPRQEIKKQEQKMDMKNKKDNENNGKDWKKNDGKNNVKDNGKNKKQSNR